MDEYLSRNSVPARIEYHFPKKCTPYLHSKMVEYPRICIRIPEVFDPTHEHLRIHSVTDATENTGYLYFSSRNRVRKL